MTRTSASRPLQDAAQSAPDQSWPDQDWAARSACVTADPDDLFVSGAAQNRAKQVCLGCPVRTECLGDALDHRVEFGVWGGMTERERRALLKRRPDVVSWTALLRQAKQDHDGAARASQAS